MIDDGRTWDLPDAERVAAADDALAPGSKLGHFVIERRLGEGGMGIVLACRDVDLDRRVAVKVVRTGLDHSAFRARLVREAAAMAKLDHPNVVRIYEVGNDRGRLFVAMELIDGMTLKSWLEQPHSPAEVLAMFEQVGTGLAVVHEAGLIHRDFKPDNVLVDHSGRARVADFGLARLETKDSASPHALAASLTMTGAAMGTLGYMAPEQQFGAEVDARADQYSYCVALREATRAGRSPRVEAVLARGLSYEPEGRFGSMRELLATLREPKRARRGAPIVAALVVTAGVGGAVITAVALRSHGASPIADAAAPPQVVTVIPDATVLADAAIAVAAPPQSAQPAQPPPAPPKPAGPHEIEKSHVAAVRAATRDLGFGGLTFTGNDLDGDIKDLQAQIAALGEDDHVKRVRLEYGLGGALRKRGDCGGALDAFGIALKELQIVQKTPGAHTYVWFGRVDLAAGICMMQLGHALAAKQRVDRTTSIGWDGEADERERNEAAVVRTIAACETGDASCKKSLDEWSKSPGLGSLRPVLATWAKANGFAFP